MMFSRLVFLLLLLCSGSEICTAVEKIDRESGLATILSTPGLVVDESGYNYVLYQDIEYLGGIRQEKADLYLPASFASNPKQTYPVENTLVRIKEGQHAFPIIPHETNCHTDSVKILLDFLGKYLK